MGGENALAKPRTVRKYSDEQRAQAVAESLAPGARVREVAERHGVRPNLLTYWRRQARAITPTASVPRFAAVRLGAPSVASDGVIEIDRANHCIRVRGVVDASMLREVLAATR